MKQTLKYIFDKLYENMKYAEGKHSIILALSSAVIAFASTFFNNDNIFQNIFASTCLIFALISIIYCFCALIAKNPAIKAHKNVKCDNLLNYRSIITHDEETYLKALKEEYTFLKDYKPDEFDKDLTRQIIKVAKSINVKFTYFNFSIVFLVFSILSAIVTVMIRGNLW